MKILAVTTRNFKNLADQKWNFDPKFQVVSGPNEAGKSSLLEAILVGLYADATSTDSRFERLCRWKSLERIRVALDLDLNGRVVRLERDFENRKNTLARDGERIQKKEKVRSEVEGNLPLRTEESFLQTACVKQDELRSDINASDLRNQIEQRSLSATGLDIQRLARQLEDHVSGLKRGWRTSAPKNPGPIKQLEDELARLKNELDELEEKEKAAGSALAELQEEVAPKIQKLEEELTSNGKRLDWDKEYLEADRAYEQRRKEIAELTRKRERLKALPGLIKAAQGEHSTLESSLEELKKTLEGALAWKNKHEEIQKVQASVSALDADIAQLKACDEEMRAVASPLPPNVSPDDLARFRTLVNQRQQWSTATEGERREADRLTEQIQTALHPLAVDTGRSQELEAALAKLKAEKELSERAAQMRQKGERLAGEKRKLSDKLHQLAALAAEGAGLERELAAYAILDTVDLAAFSTARSAVNALERAIENEGIGVEIDPQRPIDLTLQFDGAPEESHRLETARKFLARKEILLQIPGLGRLRVTNESRSARQLEERGQEIAQALARTSAADASELLDRFGARDKLAELQRTSEAKLQAALESRPLSSWQDEAARFEAELDGLRTALQELGSTRDPLSIEQDLESQQGQLSLVNQRITEARTRDQLLTQNLEQAKARLASQEGEMRELQEQIGSILVRARQQEEMALLALEESYKSYQQRLAEIQDGRSRALKGRLEDDIYKRYESERALLDKLKPELDRLGPAALADDELPRLRTEIANSQAEVRAKADEIAGLKRERELLEAERLDEKLSEAVTQAEIADKRRKEYEPYSFPTPDKRIEFTRQTEELREELKKLERRHAELKVKSEAVGEFQGRIVEVKEAIADRKQQLERLKHSFEVDSKVLEILDEAREKAFDDLLDAIPERVGGLLARITGGRYNRTGGRGFNLLPWSPAKGAAMDMDEISRGTLDQFYLSVRLEALRAMFPKDLPPLILDDALVSSDPERRQRIVSILEEHSNSGQVILLTCHDWPELENYPRLHLG